MASGKLAPEGSHDAPFDVYEAYGPSAGESWDGWNPTEESVRPLHGRHRVGKQRNGLARSGTVLGVGLAAAVGAGGLATAQEKPNASVSLPDLASLPDNLPDVDGLLPGGGGDDKPETTAPLTQVGLTVAETESGQIDAGEALRARILKQANQQQAAADQKAVDAASSTAAEEAAKEAAKATEAERKAEEEQRRKAEEERQRKAEEERRRKAAAGFSLPLGSYQGLGPGFGASGSMWANNHTGQDFTAPNGTPTKAVHSGEIAEAGWAGSYGYRIILKLDDGTEIWYCHLSSMTRTSGQVSSGDVIGNVGSTGNSTGPHLHLEVRTADGSAIDPLGWLRGKGLTV